MKKNSKPIHLCFLWQGQVSVSICGFMLLIFLSAAAFAAERGLVPIPLVDDSGAQVGLYKESHALVIGVSDYTAGWPDLPGVLVDIHQVSGILRRHGFNVTVVKNPTRKSLDEAFANFIHRHGQEEDNRLLVYFAGHGHTVKLAYGAEMGYIVPADAPHPDRDANGFLAKAMDMQQIEVYAKRMQSKHALFLFDSCFAGSFFGLTRAIPRSISFKTSRPVRQFITSGSAGETVSDDSVFRRLFVAALEGEGDVNGDGYLTGTELGQFLQDGVINYTRASQHPQYGTLRDPFLDKGDFVFPLLTRERLEQHLADLQAEGKNLEQERKRIERENQLVALRRKIEQEQKRIEAEKSRLKKEGQQILTTLQQGHARKIGSWVVFENGTAVDTNANLMWMTKDFYNIEGRPPADWHDAMAWVDRMNRGRFGGYGDWRVPTVAEYQSIYDARRTRRGFSLKKSRGAFALTFDPKPVGYPQAFEDGGGHWYWTREEADPARCGLSAKSHGECFATFNYRGGNAGTQPPIGGDAATSSIRLVRDVD